jgi:hypothetical protein
MMTRKVSWNLPESADDAGYDGDEDDDEIYELKRVTLISSM